MKVFHSRKGAEQTEKMEGSKAAYQQEEPIDDEHYTTPAHGDRAWEIAHLDHTLMDVALIDSEKGDVFHGRAWLTLLICAFSRRILAHYISFDKPSRVSCMGVIRDCVRRWRRLPEIIFVDQGKEFWSSYFQSLLAHFHCDVRWRPPTKPRFGAIIERFFHTLNKQFFHNLLGNTKIMKKARQVTKAVNPENLAVWDLPMLDEHLEHYLYEEYDNRVHSSLSRSPRAEFEASLKKFNAPPPCDIEYDEEFLLETMISTAKETRMVKQSRGVTVYGTWYRSKKLRNAALYDTQVPVNIDPFDASHVYVYVGGQWEECFAPPRVFALLKGKSVGLMHAISEEVRQRGKAKGVRSNTHFEDLALAYATHEEGEKVKKRRMQDEELEKIARAKSRSVSTATHDVLSLEEETGEAPDNVIKFEELKTYKKMRRG